MSPPGPPEAAWSDDRRGRASSNGHSSGSWRAQPHDRYPAPDAVASSDGDAGPVPSSGRVAGPSSRDPHDVSTAPSRSEPNGRYGDAGPAASSGRAAAPSRSEPHDPYDPYAPPSPSESRDLYGDPGSAASSGRAASPSRSEPHDPYDPYAPPSLSESRDLYGDPGSAGSAGRAASSPPGGGWSVPPDRTMPTPGPTAPDRQVFVPPPDMLPDPGPPDPPGGWGPPPAHVPDAPPARGPGPGGPMPMPARPRRPRIDRRRLAVVYDIEGPRVRLGIAWFAGALVATLISPFTAALVYAAAAGLAARQIVKAWGSISWQVDVATGLGALPVLAALAGPQVAAVALVVVGVVAVGCAAAPDGARLPGAGGRLAAAGILCLSAVPALAGASFVLVRTESVVAAVVLLGLVSAYEAGDYIVGSGASNSLEGPLAGITASTLLALPLALILVEPFDAAGVILLGFTAVACPLGQIVASAALPGAGAYAPALRRIDTLIILAPLWAAAAGAF